MNSLLSLNRCINFDWGNNGMVDHVGIVESVVEGVVHTVEGNSGDAVKRNTYIKCTKKTGNNCEK